MSASVIPGLAYVGVAAPWGWGVQLVPTFRLGTNSNDYTLGNRYQVGVWGARRLASWVTLSLRVGAERWENVRGADPELDQEDEPSKNPLLQGGRRLDLSAGFRFHPASGVLEGQQIYLEADAPLMQSLDGPQIQKRWAVRFGLQWEF